MYRSEHFLVSMCCLFDRGDHVQMHRQDLLIFICLPLQRTSEEGQNVLSYSLLRKSVVMLIRIVYNQNMLTNNYILEII